MNFGRLMTLWLAAALTFGCAERASAPPSLPTAGPKPATVALTNVELTRAVETVVARIAPSIVHLSGAMPASPLRSRLETLEGPAVRVLRAGPLGSGVLVNGVVVTSRHIIEHTEELRAHLADGRVVRATVLHRDVDHDLAVLRLDGDVHELATMRLADPALVRRGEIVLAVGNPYGQGCTVTLGLVSSRDVEGDGAVQTDAAINPHNSGGALVNLRGELIGIANSKLTDEHGLRGMGYATPVEDIIAALGAARSEPPLRPRAATPARYALRGIATTDAGSDRPQEDQLHGARITRVDAESPAARLGIQPGDVVMEIDLGPIVDAETFERAVDVTGPRLLLLLRGSVAVYLIVPP